MAEQDMKNAEQSEASTKDKRSFKDDLLANLAAGAGLISIGTDILGGSVDENMYLASFVLEILAVVLGVIALSKGQNKNRAWLGIVLGGIGLGMTVIGIFMAG
ncbi:hypothetical protein FWH13_01010 [Candidatus Saccharibacteria bacterium]|nr:hypothetical protein [Candidatus Saccharibacteria bacterium]